MQIPPKLSAESLELFERGAALERAGRSEAAGEAYQAAIQADPRNYAAMASLGGLIWQLRGDLEGALEQILAGLEIHQTNIPMLFGAAMLLGMTGRAALAREFLDHAIRLAPDLPRIHLTRAHIAIAEHDFVAAQKHLARAVEADPDDHDSLNALATTYVLTRRYDEGVKIFEDLLRQRPGDPVYLHNYGYFLSNFAPSARAERFLEHGFQCGVRRPNRRLAASRWRGEALTGQSLVIWREQGIGDFIRFSGHFAALIARAERTVLLCPPKMLPLYERSFPGAEIKPDTISDAEVDALGCTFEAPAGCLWHYLPEEEQLAPVPRAYLVPDPDRVAYWKRRLGFHRAKATIGISWTSKARDSGLRTLHYLTLDQIASQLRIPGTRLVSLQYTPAADEIRSLKSQSGIDVIQFPEIDLMDDLDEAAAITATLDCVVTVPNSVGDMAAALGMETAIVGRFADLEPGKGKGTPHQPHRLRYYLDTNAPVEATFEAVRARLTEVLAAKLTGA